MRTLVTVCARGGSKGVENKNLLELGGRSLMAWTVGQARRWGRAERIVCSTDSEAIARSAREAGAEVPFLRPAELSGDTVGKVPVIRHALREVEREGGEYDAVIDLDITNPIRPVEHLEACYQRFLERRPEVLFTVVPARRNPYFNMVERHPDGTLALPKSLPAGVLRRQDAPRVFDLNASIYIYEARALREERFSGVLQARFDIHEMPEETAFDIDSGLDVVLVTAIMRHLGWIDGGDGKALY